MKKIRISLVALSIFLISVLMVGCSSSPEKVLQDAINKNKEITYSKQDANIGVTIAGMSVNVKATGDVDHKNQKSAIKLTANIPMAEEGNIAVDMYQDKNTVYTKDPHADKYMKVTLDEAELKNANNSSSIAGNLISNLKDNKTVKDTLKLKDGDNSDKVVTAKIPADTVKQLIDKALSSQNVFETMQSAIETQLIDMASQLGEVNKSKEEIEKAAKEEAKTAVEEYKKMITALKFGDVDYTGKIDKSGYLYAEDISVDVTEASTNLTLNLKLSLKATDINASGKTVTIPNIPSDKIEEIK